MAKPGPDPTVSYCDILEVLITAYEPVLSTSEIADFFEISRQAMNSHLDRLEEEGDLESKKAGQARLWWTTDQGRRYYANECREGGQDG